MRPFHQTAKRLSALGAGKCGECSSRMVKQQRVRGGPDFSAADVNVGSHVKLGMEDGTLESRPVFIEYARRMHARPPAIKANEIDDALVDFRNTP